MNKKIIPYSKFLFNFINVRSGIIGAMFLQLLITESTFANTITSVASGNWKASASWSPAMVPTINDDVIIASGHIITLNSNEAARNITVSSGASLVAVINKKLTVSGNLTVNGTMSMNGCNIVIQNSGSLFTLGNHGSFTWEPGTNTVASATLFTNCTESIDSGSTLIIKKWYDYSVALNDVITGNFGNLVINSPGSGNTIVEWNQKNHFENHRVLGTLTIDQGWITLDKSGAISSTSLKDIVLTSANSSFYALNGTHTSSFVLNTRNITNNGGNFYGINDGNGNITLNVNGDITNSGSVKVINNSGIAGVSNGNAQIRVDGIFSQSSGDTRFIYNISTTNSGTFTATIKNLILTGGIFMGQSACHTSGNANTLNIAGNMSVNFSNATDKFRGNGISSIGSDINNASFYLNVNGNLTVNGNPQSEFTGSASSGPEFITVTGNAEFNGGAINFNYGTIACSHSAEINIHGNLKMNGGHVWLSRNNGTLHSIVNGSLLINGGQMALKGSSGPADISVLGKLIQTDGNLIFHTDNQTATNENIKLTVNGSFRHSGGTINFDENNSGAMHTLSLKGDSCTLSGNSTITRNGRGNPNSIGNMSFDRQGRVYYVRLGEAPQIEQVLQTVNSQCELSIKACRIKVSSNASPGIAGFLIAPGGRLVLKNSTLFSNGLQSHCLFEAAASSYVSLTNESGFNGGLTTALSQEIELKLHEESTVEYCGEKGQTITGVDPSIIQQQNKYGILRITLSDPKHIALASQNLFVRKKLELNQGDVRLDNHSITVENGSPDAIKRIKGFIDCDINPNGLLNTINWMNITTGLHEFPFGRLPALYLPVKFTPASGAGNSVSISTRRTEKNNLPRPDNTTPVSPSNILAETKLIDRWWTIAAQGVTGELKLTYAADENTIVTDMATATLAPLQWASASWVQLGAGERGVVTGTGIFTIRNYKNTSHLALMAIKDVRTFALKLFEAEKIENDVNLRWETDGSSSESLFAIEKSTDGENFYELGTLPSNYSSSGEYMYSDKSFFEDVAYYRLRLEEGDKPPSYSVVKMVSLKDSNAPGRVKINSISPNPFTSTIKVQFTSPGNTTMEVIDMQGRKVLDIPTDGQSEIQKSYVINLGFLREGIYFLNIICDGKKDAMRIIKND